MAPIRSFAAISVGLFLVVLCQGQGCQGIAILPFDSTGMDDDLSVSDFDLGTASTVPVEAGVVGTARTSVTVDADFSDDVFFVLKASDISISIDESSPTLAQTTPGAGAADRFALITLRLARSGGDACGSDVEVGPFEVTVSDGTVSVVEDTLPLDELALQVVAEGRFDVCFEAWADFAGSVSCGRVGVESHRRDSNDENSDDEEDDMFRREKVVVCHIPPGNPDRHHTIEVSRAALDAHLAHGDTTGPCDATDTDGDGVLDTEDACLETPAGHRVNADGCACVQTDECDLDGDGTADADDLCPDTTAGSDVDANGCSCAQRDACDTDGDGVPDAEDACPETPDADQSDSDGDGVGDACDNCPDEANADQEDADANGVGDACDEADTDGDGISDRQDNCPATANADQADADTDGVGDACEQVEPGACFAVASSWATYDAGANGVGVHPDGYVGAVFDGRYVYFVPHRDGSANEDRHGEVMRYDTAGSFSDVSSWAAFDPGANGVGNDPDGYAGGVFDGRYVYFAPFDNGSDRSGEVLRLDTTGAFSSAASWTTFDAAANGVGNNPVGFNGAVFDGRYIFFVPNSDIRGVRSGEVLRFDTSGGFTDVAAWAAYDPGNNGVGADADGFFGAVFDGRYIYFVPGESETGGYDGEVLRYDTAGVFADASSWTAFDPGNNGVGADPDGYVGAVFDGRYVYFVPAYNGSEFHGEVLRFDTTAGFSEASSWATFDPGANGVGVYPDGYHDAVFDGRFIYFAPYNNNTDQQGEVLRFDTAGSFTDIASWSAFDAGANGVGTDPDGYWGGAFDGRYIYFSPDQNGNGVRHGEVLRYDTAADCN